MSTPRSRDAALLALLLAAAAAVCAAGDDDAAQRARIERERAQVEARARAGERACAGRFVVAACLNQVRAERREALQQLEHQRALLDEAQRKRRAAERQARIQQRQEAQAREDEQRLPPRSAGARAPVREPQAEPPAAAQDSGSPRRVNAAAGDAAAARRAQATRERAKELEAHRAAVERRNRDKAANRPRQAPLPVPGASAPGG